MDVPFLTVSELKRKARLAVKKGTLQATRAMKNPAYRGGCHYRHPIDPDCKCVIGLGIPDDYPLNHNNGVFVLVQMKQLSFDDDEGAMDLQITHDDVCTAESDEERQEAYKRFLQAIGA